MLTRARVTWIVLFAALAMLAAACGGSVTGEAGEVSDDTTGTSTVDSGEPTDGTEASGDEPLPETLADFWGYGEDFDPAEEEAKWREQEMEVQEYVAECMANEGFEYTPYLPEETFAYYGPGEDLSEEEWTAKYGYGVFTMMLEEQQAWEEGTFDEQWNPEDDPNWVYQESLSESERAAYEIALWGNWENWEEPEPVYDDEGNEIWDESMEPDWAEIGGCYNLAQAEVFPGFGGPDPELEALWNELGPKQEEMWERIQSDPRVVEANQQWASCMADAGYTYASQEEIHEYLWGLQEEWWAESEQYWRDIEAQAETLPEEEREAFYEEAYADTGPWPPGVTEEEIRALADEELAIAAADLNCRGDMNEIMEEVSKEYESQFIAENIDLLRKIKAAQDEMGW